MRKKDHHKKYAKKKIIHIAIDVSPWHKEVTARVIGTAFGRTGKSPAQAVKNLLKQVRRSRGTDWPATRNTRRGRA